MIQMAREAIAGLKGNPLALALILVNVLYLAAIFLAVREDRSRQDVLIHELLQLCDGKQQ